ncbi:acylneuraminate cytidylyltransferase family protein [Shewanella sp. 38A_GOM-205m]|uniref:acylneuraminate cytidylyltransferase family protein n=1 Tax=Shewanella sp. 38A_GOM-205m TaxID=1380363 RepID=UPI00048D2205|nr:acylneuraminate cytidylyltransferase family protein [Shewanella sp. 38A_GOM-205m]
MKNYAFIFARGGSKGLPGKNTKPLAGKPLLHYSIDSALAAPSIEQVFVSTDDAEIAQVARNGGAIVIDRPAELASDTSPEWLSWRHAIEWVRANYDDFDGFISLPATAPLRAVSDIENAIQQRMTVGADICISVTPASRSPFFNMVKQTDSGMVELVIKPQGEVARRQDAPAVFDITTVVYATTPEFVLNHYGLFSGNVTSIEVPKERAVDIDDIYDFMLAEAILMENKKHVE